MNKKKIIITVSVLGVILLLFFLLSGEDKKAEALYATVEKGDFEITVFTTGELEAKNSVKIFGPDGIRSIGIWNVKISDIIPEGTVVKKGDYVASLDPSEVTNKMKDAESELQKAESQYTQTKLDTALQLRQARDEMINQKYSVEEKEITLEQSAYEPPATIRQTQLELEKIKRSYQQAEQNYKIKESQLKAKMQEAMANLQQVQTKIDNFSKVIGEFSIVAPEDGMLIYEREWNGQKKIVGSSISAWDPTVATLPDLSVMLSRTYVNEVDIRKLKVGQAVNITLDAFPEKKLTGKVKSVANVGEQNPKSDAKVFEVMIQVNEKDTTLRPAMTTGNNVLMDKIKDVLYVPLECLHNQGDSISYVLIHEGLGGTKREVIVGATNENFAEIKEGVEKGEELYLSLPEGIDAWSLTRLTKKPAKKK